MFDLDVAIAVEEVGEIAGDGETCHLGAVACVVVGAPGGLDAVEVGGAEDGTDERMSSVDAGVEEANMGCFRAAVEAGALEQVVHPTRLFVECQRVEEVRRLFRATQFGDAVEGRDGLPDGRQGRAGDEDAALGEAEFAWGNLHAEGRGHVPGRC